MIMENKKENVKNTIWQFIKFNIIGISNTVVDFVLYYILTAVGLNYLVSQVISYGAGIVNSYIWNTKWTFSKEKRRDPKEMLGFFIVNIAALLVSMGILYLCQNVFNVPDIGPIPSSFVSKCISAPFSIAVGFIGNKLFVFKRKDGDAEKADAGDDK